MPKYNSNVQNQTQWHDFNLLKIHLENSGYNILINLNEIKIEKKRVNNK